MVQAEVVLLPARAATPTRPATFRTHSSVPGVTFCHCAHRDPEHPETTVYSDLAIEAPHEAVVGAFGRGGILSGDIRFIVEPAYEKGEDGKTKVGPDGLPIRILSKKTKAPVSNRSIVLTETCFTAEGFLKPGVWTPNPPRASAKLGAIATALAAVPTANVQQ